MPLVLSRPRSKGIQRQQDDSYRVAMGIGERPNLTTVFIEVAHEFLPSRRIRSMPVLFEQVARIAWRGRKRWLGQVFITQLPQQSDLEEELTREELAGALSQPSPSHDRDSKKKRT